MKKAFFLFSFFSISLMSFAQNNLEGAWNLKQGNNTIVLLFKDGYFTSTEYSSNTFINSWGGPFSINGNSISVKKEFDTQNKEETGTIKQLTYSEKDGKLTIKKEDHPSLYTRLDNGNAPLAGVWKITGREQDGKLIEIHQTGARKTLKMLTGGRFQWFAINPETKQFSGTGGGTYTFENGKYTENILFFSRDSSRIGAKLVFDGKLEDDKWHHSGLSSKGDKIYEVWGKVKS
jgi:hypothetical protein